MREVFEFGLDTTWTLVRLYWTSLYRTELSSYSGMAHFVEWECYKRQIAIYKWQLKVFSVGLIDNRVAPKGTIKRLGKACIDILYRCIDIYYILVSLIWILRHQHCLLLINSSIIRIAGNNHALFQTVWLPYSLFIEDLFKKTCYHLAY